MAKVLQVLDVDHTGHRIRLDNGDVILFPCGGHVPCVGEEVVIIGAESTEGNAEGPEQTTAPAPNNKKRRRS